MTTPAGYFEHYRRHPVDWVRDALGVALIDYQQEILTALVDHPVVTVRSCHTAGKSMVAACAVLWSLYCHVPSKVITTAPTKRQVIGILWSEISSLYQRAIRPLGGKCLTSAIQIESDWFAFGFTSRETDDTKFQGFHSPNILVVVDEAAGVAPKIFEQTDTILAGGHWRQLLIGNPTQGTGDFFESFREQGTSKHKIDVFHTPNFLVPGITIEDIRSGAWEAKVPDPLPYPALADPRTVARLWRKWGESSTLWTSRMLAEFPRTSDEGLVPLAWLEAAVQRGQGSRWKGAEAVHLGVDIARYGPDHTVAAEAYADQGIRRLHRAPKSDTVDTAGWINSLLRANDSITEVRIDADGLGAGVFDVMRREHGGCVKEMRGGMAPLDTTRFLNRRAEWLWTLRESCDPARDKPMVLPDDEDLIYQLTSMRWRTTPKGLIQIESKDDMRGRGMDSPDAADACAYAWAVLTLSAKRATTIKLDLTGARVAPLAGLNRG